MGCRFVTVRLRLWQHLDSTCTCNKGLPVIQLYASTTTIRITGGGTPSPCLHRSCSSLAGCIAQTCNTRPQMTGRHCTAERDVEPAKAMAKKHSNPRSDVNRRGAAVAVPTSTHAKRHRTVGRQDGIGGCGGYTGRRKMINRNSGYLRHVCTASRSRRPPAEPRKSLVD